MTQTRDEQAVLDEIVRRIVQVADPDKIILFGSHARGDAGPDSDYDVLVVAPSEEDISERAAPIYRAMSGLLVPYDIVWWTPDEIAEWRDARAHFVNRAIREGSVIYERAA